MAEISKLNGYDLKDKQSRADIAGMKDGTIKVKAAEQADNANRADSASVASIAASYIVSGTYENPVTKIIANKFSEVEQTIQNVANGVNRGYSFDSIDKLIGDLEGQTANTKYKIGDELYIKSTDKPDYWVAEVKDTKGSAVTSIADGATVGYWVLYKLGEKTDLTLYQTKTDTGLNTTTKTVVGGINEIKGDIRFILDGTNWVDTARKADKDLHGFVINSTYIAKISVDGNNLIYEKGSGADTSIPLPDWTYIGTSPITVVGKQIGIKQAEENMPGVIKIGYSANGRNYPVVLDEAGKAYINVPWTDTVYTLPVATTTVRGGVKVGAVRSAAVTTNAASSTDGRYYMVERDSAEKLFVNIPWQNTTYGLATQTAQGLMSAQDKTKLDHIGISVTGEEMTITLS